MFFRKYFVLEPDRSRIGDGTPRRRFPVARTPAAPAVAPPEWTVGTARDAARIAQYRRIAERPQDELKTNLITEIPIADTAWFRTGEQKRFTDEAAARKSTLDLAAAALVGEEYRNTELKNIAASNQKQRDRDNTLADLYNLGAAKKYTEFSTTGDFSLLAPSDAEAIPGGFAALSPVGDIPAATSSAPPSSGDDMVFKILGGLAAAVVIFGFIKKGKWK